MTTAHLAHFGIVTSPLILRRWRWVMGNFDLTKWVMAGASLITLGIVGGQLLWGGGGIMSGQSKDIQALQAQQNTMAAQLSALQAQVAPLATLSLQIDKMASLIERAPRADLINSQLTEIQRHLSALDGRMDGMDTRARTDEDRIIRDDTRLDSIEKASREPLGHNR